VRPLGPHAYSQRLATIIARLDALGVLEVVDRGAQGAVRRLTIDLLAPGQREIPELPDEARFHYEEWFSRVSGASWIRVRYQYNYFDVGRGGWRGHHLHPLESGGDPVPHAKCVLADGSGRDRHFAAYEVDLLAAHDEFELLYASGQAIDCRGLRAIG
jgi:hypothetical protein